MTSLRRRLRRVVAVLTIGLLSQWFIADRMIVYVGESEMTTRLQHDADSLAAAVAVGSDRTVVIDATTCAPTSPSGRAPGSWTGR